MKHAAALLDQFVSESLRIKAAFFQENRNAIVQTAERIAHGLRDGKKMLFFGNGGSAADSQHLAAEMVGRFGPDRSPLAAIALTTDTSILTAIANDYGYEEVFARQVAGLSQPGDLLVTFSTSGESENLLRAALAAQECLVKVIANTPHNNHLDSDDQYPPGLGVPQWKLKERVSAWVVDVVHPGEIYK